jgi:hypothetical protein
MNSYEHRQHGITDQEAESLRGDFEQMGTFSEREQLAIAYTRVISQTPLKFHPDLVERVKSVFTEREFVILASTAAQVNYWARLIQALGIPPAGFGSDLGRVAPDQRRDTLSSQYGYSSKNFLIRHRLPLPFDKTQWCWATTI